MWLLRISEGSPRPHVGDHVGPARGPDQARLAGYAPLAEAAAQQVDDGSFVFVARDAHELLQQRDDLGGSLHLFACPRSQASSALSRGT